MSENTLLHQQEIDFSEEILKKKKFIGDLYKCKVCKLLKPAGDFWKRSTSRSGLNSTCIECMQSKYQSKIIH